MWGDIYKYGGDIYKYGVTFINGGGYIYKYGVTFLNMGLYITVKLHLALLNY